jgi:hypothetical protein
MDKIKRFLNKSKIRNDISHLYGYENLEFGEIREKLLKHLDSLHISTVGIRKENEQKSFSSYSNETNNLPLTTPTVKPVQGTDTVIKSISIPTVKTFQRTEIKPISLLEYQQKLELMEKAERSANAIGSPTNLLSTPVKTVPRHALESQEEVQKQFPPFKESYIDPKVIWIILYMVHLILTKPRKRKPNSYEFDPFTGISNKELIEVFRSKRRVTAAKYIASASGILERFEYVPNKYVDKFRINGALLLSGTLGRITSFPVVNSEINTLLIDAREREKSNMDDVTQYSLKVLKTLRIQTKEAIAFIESSYQQECDRLRSKNKLTEETLTHLLSTRDADITFVHRIENFKGNKCPKRDDFGRRLHTLFTQSPKRLRRFLFFEGVKDDLFILDLANAQPLLLVPTLMEHYQQNEWRDYNFEINSVPTFLQLLRIRGKNENVIKYIQLVQDGKLYEEMHKLLIEARFTSIQPLHRLCNSYFSNNNRTQQDTLSLIASIHSNLPALRQLLKYDAENEQTRLVLHSLFKIRKPNLGKSNLIDIDFVIDLLKSIGRAFHSEMTSEQKKKIKTQLARHVYYGLLPGQTKKTKNPKPMVIGEVNKKRKTYPILIKKVFMQHFPHVWNVIEDVKRFNYKELARELQGREANVFVDHILRDLIVKEKRPHFLSLHDGILCKKADVEMLKDRIAQEFKQWGLQVPLNIDNITKGESEKIILNRQADVFRLPFIEVKQGGEMKRLYAKAS